MRILALDECDAALGIHAAGEHQREGIHRIFAQCGRLLHDRDRVQIGDRINTFVFVL